MFDFETFRTYLAKLKYRKKAKLAFLLIPSNGKWQLCTCSSYLKPLFSRLICFRAEQLYQPILWVLVIRNWKRNYFHFSPDLNSQKIMPHISGGGEEEAWGGAVHKDQEALRTQELIIKICILLVIAYAILIPLRAKFINLWNSSRTGIDWSSSRLYTSRRDGVRQLPTATQFPELTSEARLGHFRIETKLSSKQGNFPSFCTKAHNSRDILSTTWI